MESPQVRVPSKTHSPSTLHKFKRVTEFALDRAQFKQIVREDL